MPREKQPARLWLRPAGNDRDSVWVVLNDGKQISTRCGKSNRDGAEKILQEHLTVQFSLAPKTKQRAAEEIYVAEVVASYLTVKGQSVARPKELAQRMDRILDWWGEKTLADISRATCKQYCQDRGSSAAARRGLEELSSAINKAGKDRVWRPHIQVTRSSGPSQPS